ncbi:unnamed protein product [Arabidopsis lyrata]|nr:unnamed protein product [Arabidopsis lyrata]
MTLMEISVTKKCYIHGSRTTYHRLPVKCSARIHICKPAIPLRRASQAELHLQAQKNLQSLRPQTWNLLHREDVNGKRDFGRSSN